MKKTILFILLVLLGLCLLYVVFNRFDAKADPGMFSAKELPADNFDFENGYYRLWTLGLDDKVDVEAVEVKERYRRLFDPQFDNDKEIREFDWEKHKKKTSTDQRLGKVLLAGLSKMDRVGEAPPVSMAELLKEKMDFVHFRDTQPVLLQRYERFLASEFFQDFTALKAASPIPNLLTWLRLAKLRIGLSLVDASDGKWGEAADALIKQMDFGKKAVAGSSVMITNLVAKAVLNLSAQGLAYLMNQRECPAEVFSRVLAAMPPLRYEEYGSRNSFIGEFLIFRKAIDRLDSDVKISDLMGVKGFLSPLGFQNNRTMNDYHEYLKALVQMEASPLQGDLDALMAPKKRRQGAFWWLRNPTGKIFLDAAIPNLGIVVFKALRTKSLYDMTRISAELHLRYDAARSVQENLNRLAVYQQIPDPCSGKPYIWNDGKQVLYSVGIDRVDGGGSYDRQTIRTDVVLPCILYIRSEIDQQKNR